MIRQQILEYDNQKKNELIDVIRQEKLYLLKKEDLKLNEIDYYKLKKISKNLS